MWSWLSIVSEPQILYRYAEHRCIRQVSIRIHRGPADPYFIMEVRRRGASAATHQPENLAAANLLAGVNQNPRKMRVVSVHPGAMIDDHQPAIPAAHRLGAEHDAV